MNARTCRLVTLGCKVSQYETQYVKETLEQNGYREAADGEPADLCLVNTCTSPTKPTPRAVSSSAVSPRQSGSGPGRHGLLRHARRKPWPVCPA
jgi:hypothetical protein